MSDPDGETGALLRSAEEFTRNGLAAFGYVEAREIAAELIPNAVVSARAYGTSHTHFTGAVYDGRNRLLRSSLGFSEGPYTPLDPDEIAAERREGALRVKSAIYGGTLYYVLGHFLFETVARLWLGVDLARRRGRGDFPVIFHPWPGLDLDAFFANAMYRSVMEALGIRRRDVGLAHADILVGALHYPSPLSIYHEYLHPQMGPLFDYLGDELERRRGFLPRLTAPRAGRPARIFLSRGRWPANRRILNEAALEELFGAQGFAIVHPQEVGPARLVALLRGASVVASTDGSQAHLAVFCRPGTRMILIDTRPVPTQFAIAKLRDLSALHVPICTNGQWDPADRLVDVSPRMERLIAAALRAAP